MTKQKLTRKELGIQNKKGAGRPRKTATIQLNRRVAWNNYDSTKTLLDAVIDDPSMLPALLAIARSHTAQRPVRNHPHTGTAGN